MLLLSLTWQGCWAAADNSFLRLSLLWSRCFLREQNIQVTGENRADQCYQILTNTAQLWLGRCWIYKLIGWFDLVRTNDYTVTRVFYLPQTSRELDLHIRFDLSALDLGSLTRWCWWSWWSLARSWWVWLLAVMLQYGSLVMTSHTFTLATTCLIPVKSSEQSCSTFNI